MTTCEHHESLHEDITEIKDSVKSIDEAIRGSQDGEVQGLIGRVHLLECKDKRNNKIQMAALVAFIAVIVDSGWKWITR